MGNDEENFMTPPKGNLPLEQAKHPIRGLYYPTGKYCTLLSLIRVDTIVGLIHSRLSQEASKNVLCLRYCEDGIAQALLWLLGSKQQRRCDTGLYLLSAIILKLQ